MTDLPSANDGLGYSIAEDVLSEAECQRLLDAVAPLSGGPGRAGARHLMSVSVVAELARDRRLLGIAERVLESGAVPYRATLFEKSGRANWLVVWHQDTALPLAQRFEADGWGPWSQKAGVHYAHAPAWALARIVALRVHLDASTSDNGPLRVIPGSQRAGVLSDDEVLAWAHTHTAVECLAGRGGVLAMRPLLIHASSKARLESPRRVLHIEYADTLDLAPGIGLAVA